MINSPEATAIILAGGKGTRMMELVKLEQKCMLPFEGKPILEHIVTNIAEAYGTIRVIFCVGHYGERVKSYFERHDSPVIKTEFVPHTPGDEIKKALLTTEGLISDGESFLVTPGDIIAPAELYAVLTNIREVNDASAVLSLAQLTQEAPTHNVAKITQAKDYYNGWRYGLVRQIEHPPPRILQPNHFRDMTIYAMASCMYSVLRKQISPEQLYISPGIGEVLQKTDSGTSNEYLAVSYPGPWLHFAHPEDLYPSRPWLDTEEIDCIIKNPFSVREYA